LLRALPIWVRPGTVSRSRRGRRLSIPGRHGAGGRYGSVAARGGRVGAGEGLPLPGTLSALSVYVRRLRGLAHGFPHFREAHPAPPLAPPVLRGDVGPGEDRKSVV